MLLYVEDMNLNYFKLVQKVIMNQQKAISNSEIR